MLMELLPTGTHRPWLPRAQLYSRRRPHTSSKALSAERRTPGLGSRGWPSFHQLSTGGGMAWPWHSRTTDSLATTDTFSSSPRRLGGTAAGQEKGYLRPVRGQEPGAGPANCQ